MGLFDRKPKNENVVVPAIKEERSFSDYVKTGTEATSGANTAISAFFAAAQLISNSIAELPIVVKIDGVEDDEHPINHIFETENQSKFTFVKSLMWDLLLRGKAFAYIAERKNGIPSKLQYLEAASTQVNYNNQTGVLYFQSNQVRAGKILPKDMLYFYMNSNDGVQGRAISAYADRILGLCKSTDSQASNYYANGGNIYGLLTLTGNPSQEEIEKIRANWRLLHSGTDSSGIAILKSTMQYQNISNNASDNQLLETREFNITEIARLFNINPVLLGDLSHSSYNTIEAAQLEFITHTLLPYITMIEAEMNKKLCTGTNIVIDLDEKYLLRSDKASMASYLNSLVSNGIMTRNEARKQLGLAPIDGGDSLTVSYSDVTQNTIGEAEE